MLKRKMISESELPKPMERVESGDNARAFLGSAFHIFYFKNKPFLKLYAYPDDAVCIQLYADVDYTDAALKFFDVVDKIGFIKFDERDRLKQEADELHSKVRSLEWDLLWQKSRIEKMNERDKDYHRIEIENKVLRMRIDKYEEKLNGTL